MLLSGLRTRPGASLAGGALLLAALAPAPVAHALDDCGVGMSYSYVTQQCEPWAPVGVDGIYDPAIPVAIPNFNVVPDVNIGLPGVNVGLPGVDLPRVDPNLRGIDAPLRDAPLRDAPIRADPIRDVPHDIPVHGGRR